MTCLSLVVLVGLSFIVVRAPFALAGLFVIFLVLSRVVVAMEDSFLGFIMFVVYVGGALVLFSYCFILTPLQSGNNRFPYWLLPFVIVPFSFSSYRAHSCIYEFYWVSGLLLAVGVLLFFVIVCVVSLIDFSEGAMRVC